jgi:hypothetical protein
VLLELIEELVRSRLRRSSDETIWQAHFALR